MYRFGLNDVQEVISIRTDLNRFANESFAEYVTRFVSLITEFETLSEGHIRWFTHKNPYGCWICETFTAIQTFVGEVAKEEQEFLNELSPKATVSIQDEDME